MAEDAAESAGAKAPAITISTTNMSKIIRSLPLRIMLIKPPPGVPLCLHKAKTILFRLLPIQEKTSLLIPL
jgi:hypothetical protein